jgi:hypothetical protein
MPPTRLLPASLAALVLGHSSFVIPTARSAPSSPSVPSVTATAPVKNFRLPTFTDAGFRHTMLIAAEARLPDPARIDLLEMELTLFTGDVTEQIEAMLAAPLATFFPKTLLATGPDTVRLERLDLTVTGADWTYDHPAKKVVIKRDAHVIFRSPIGDIIK